MRCRTECACLGGLGACPQQANEDSARSGVFHFLRRGYHEALLAIEHRFLSPIKLHYTQILAHSIAVYINMHDLCNTITAIF